MLEYSIVKTLSLKSLWRRTFVWLHLSDWVCSFFVYAKNPQHMLSFFTERKNFTCDNWKERKIILTDFYEKRLMILSCIRNNRWNYFYVNRWRKTLFYLSGCFIICLRKSTFEIGLEWNFLISMTFLWKHPFKSTRYCQTVPLERLLLCMLGKLYAAWHILFRSLLNGNCIFSSASLPLLGQEIGAWTSSYCSF